MLGDRPRAAVIGGSIAGLMCGLLLRRAGWGVDIYERTSEPLNGRGAGIVTHEELLDALSQAGIPTSESLGIHIRFRRMFDGKGEMILETRHEQLVTSWDRLFHLMRSSFPDEHYHRGKTLTRVENLKDRVRGEFSDGSAAEADLLIGTDGFRSSVRAQLLPGLRPVYAGYVAWRGLLDEQALSPQTHGEIFATLAFSLPPQGQVLGYPVPGPGEDLRPGHRRYNLVWYRPADEHTELKDLLTDSSGQSHPISISPTRIRSEIIESLRATSEAVLAPQFAEVVRLTKSLFFQPIYDLETVRMVFDRCVILGDAAFVGRPHVAAGVTKAAWDALTLQRALVKHPDNIDAALAAFEKPRLAIGSRVVDRGRELGAYIQAKPKTPTERILAERHHTPLAVMTETADLSFLVN